MDRSREKRNKRIRKHNRLRKRVSGTATRPRLSVFRSAQHIYTQLIDDVAGKTLCSVSSIQKEIAEKLSKKTGNKTTAKEIGKLTAEVAKEKGIKEVVFDRGGFKYHGRIKELADGAREGGLKF